MTSPFSLITGPPELPWVVAVLVWRIGVPSREVFLAEIEPSLVVGSSDDFSSSQPVSSVSAAGWSWCR